MKNKEAILEEIEKYGQRVVDLLFICTVFSVVGLILATILGSTILAMSLLVIAVINISLLMIWINLIKIIRIIITTGYGK